MGPLGLPFAHCSSLGVTAHNRLLGNLLALRLLTFSVCQQQSSLPRLSLPLPLFVMGSGFQLAQGESSRAGVCAFETLTERLSAQLTG